MAKITAPVEGINDKIAGVLFTDSVGETDDERAIAYFTEAGYKVEAEAATEPETVEESEAAPVEAETPAKTAAKPGRPGAKAPVEAEAATEPEKAE